ncbi:hypothetical protein G7Y89_g4056 [Cudoniella acicularis]|uniref:Cytochrome P450 n=1 Tax=Cudoniella acicularis TaxID=354080 RepID=A0A8H4W4M5_9HELO|nr:hypothetical protein G7Y89_g4056 [Cudoniella acicularis]
MASILPSGFFSHLTTGSLLTTAFGAVSCYASIRCFYHLYLHPASKFPGPRLAAISNVWYAYHWITGKYAMAVEKAFEEYGDVVRVAPNEVAFLTPQAASDIYGAHTKHLEHFTKTDFVEMGKDDQGIAWERDPVKHRNTSKRLSPAFSMKSIKAKEPTMHKYIDLFVKMMKKDGGGEAGVELRIWTDWVAMDISAELAYSREMHQLDEMKSGPFLKAIWGVNFFVTIHQICKKFPLFTPIQFLFVPPSAVISEFQARKLATKELETRIERQGKTEHLDHFETLVPAGAPKPTKEEKKELEVLAAQLLIAGYEPISSQFLCTIMFSLQEPETYKRLVNEIRETFTRYEDITPEALTPLRYLHASLMEALRLTVIGGTGMPRVSPGATVDGNYISKGVYVQYGHFAFTRSTQYFHEPRSYRPERWLPEDHLYWKSAFKSDARESFFPFSQGPRGCPGMALAWHETRLFIAKVLWSFDVEMLPDQNIVFERDFNIHAMWEKPKFWVRFHPVVRDE